MPKKIKMKFIGGKGAPSHPYKLNEVYEMRVRYARFPWFEPLEKIVEVTVPAPTKTDSVLEEKDVPQEFEDAFAREIAGIPGGKLLGKPVTPVEAPVEEAVEVPVEAPEEVAEVHLVKTKSQLERMTKEELVTYIQSKEGVAYSSMLKAILVETALSLQSKP